MISLICRIWVRMLEYYLVTSIEYISTASIFCNIFRSWIFCFFVHIQQYIQIMNILFPTILSLCTNTLFTTEETITSQKNDFFCKATVIYRYYSFDKIIITKYKKMYSEYGYFSTLGAFIFLHIKYWISAPLGPQYGTKPPHWQSKQSTSGPFRSRTPQPPQTLMTCRMASDIFWPLTRKSRFFLWIEFC